jgi:hypothetical protein
MRRGQKTELESDEFLLMMDYYWLDFGLFQFPW